MPTLKVIGVTALIVVVVLFVVNKVSVIKSIVNP
jgi:hypothetical protein